MRRWQVWVVAAGLAVGGSVAAAAVAAAAADTATTIGQQEQPATLLDFPAAAQATLQRQARGGRLENLRTETGSDGSVVYKADVVKDGVRREVTVNADGKIVGNGPPSSERGENEGK